MTCADVVKNRWCSQVRTCARSCGLCSSAANEGSTLDEASAGQETSQDETSQDESSSSGIAGWQVGLLVLGSIIVVLLVATIVLVLKR